MSALLEQVLERTGRPFTALITGLRAKRAAALATIAAEQKTFRAVHTGHGVDEDAVAHNDRVGAAVRTARDEAHALDVQLADAHRAHVQQVTRTRLAVLLNAEPVVIESEHWSFNDTYRAVEAQTAAARLDRDGIEADTRRLADAFVSARQRLPLVEVAIRDGKAKPADLKPAEKAAVDAETALEAAHGRLRVLDEVLTAFEARRVASEGELRPRWREARAAELRIVLGRLADSLRAAALDAIEAEQRQAELERDEPGSAPIGAPYFLDAQNPMSPLVAWIENAIDCGWLDATREKGGK